MKTTLVASVLLCAVASSTAFGFLFPNNIRRQSSKLKPKTVSKTPVLNEDPTQFNVGVGIADMTGPPVEITFMGYAELSQSGEGIHTRQYSRAYIFSKGGNRLVYVVADIQAVGIAVRREVVSRLQSLYGDLYNLRNVIIAGTHTHSTPGGHLVEFILDVSILGFSIESYEAYVDGITNSIIRAHDSIQPARLFFSQAEVHNAHINRSPYSYENNPSEERARYTSNTDNTLTQVRIEKLDGSLHGVINWFAIHATSMNNSNHLVSSDNLGYAAVQMEKTLNPGRLVGKPEIVVAFTPSNHGDISPNTEGAHCQISGEECDNQFKLCDVLELCFASGPGDDIFESTELIGNYIYEGAMSALSSVGEELTDNLKVVHQFVDLSEEVVPKYNPITRSFEVNNPVHGCVPALGYSFASGTIDGSNTLNITQGTLTGNPLLDSVAHLVAGPTEEDIQCHEPKPILLATGRANIPFEWHPREASVTIIYLGGLVIAGVPGEPTTMTGRRIRDVIGQILEDRQQDPKVVVSGLVNEYIHYIATFEEYQIQRYEAASTIFGPNTLDILLNKFAELTRAALDGSSVLPGPDPIDNRDRTISLILPVVMDSSPIGRNFGDVLRQPPSTVSRGSLVITNFVAANPRNDLRHEDSYLLVERHVNNNWVVVARDSDWETKFIWDRTFSLFGNSRVNIHWQIPKDAELGTYRIRYFGASKSLLGTIRQFIGTTNTFQNLYKEFHSLPNFIQLRLAAADTYSNGYATKLSHNYLLSIDVALRLPEACYRSQGTQLKTMSLPLLADGVCEAIPNEWPVLLTYI